jgi:MobA-like NTP transferase domain
MSHASTSKPDLHAVILAEGGSLRLRPLTEHLPTCLVPVAGSPILDRQLQTLLKLRVGTITVVGGYRSIQVEQACRFYPSVHYCFNPRFSRGEPLLSTLAAIGGAPQTPVLLLRGDLIFDGSLLEPLIETGAPDTSVTARGRGIGLYRLSGESLQGLFQSARDALDRRGPDPELFPFLEASLAPRDPRFHAAPDGSWTRIVSMEDLARALKTGERGPGVLPVPPSPAPASPRPAPEAAVTPPPSPALLRVRPPHPEGDSAAGDWLPTPFLRVLHR